MERCEGIGVSYPQPHRNLTTKLGPKAQRQGNGGPGEFPRPGQGGDGHGGYLTSFAVLPRSRVAGLLGPAFLELSTLQAFRVRDLMALQLVDAHEFLLATLKGTLEPVDGLVDLAVLGQVGGLGKLFAAGRALQRLLASMGALVNCCMCSSATRGRCS